MKKLFSLQKIVVILYMLTMVATALYSLWFMTNYSDLSAHASTDYFLENFSIVVFYDGLMQGFNHTIFNFALVGLVSLIFINILKLVKKVPDKFALLITNGFSVVSIVSAIIALTRIPTLVTAYNNPNLLVNEWLTLNKGEASHMFSTSAFTLGYVLYGFVLLISVLFIVIPWVSHIVYLKKEAGENNGSN